MEDNETIGPATTIPFRPREDSIMAQLERAAENVALVVEKISGVRQRPASSEPKSIRRIVEEIERGANALKSML